MTPFCAFTSICQEDNVWVSQYLAEVERLAMPFAIHLDRCQWGLKLRLLDHPLCVGVTEQNDRGVEFDETHKQGVFDLVAGMGKFRWAVAWDVDETWEKDALAKLAVLTNHPGNLLRCWWVNLWGDASHIRVDGPFGGGRRVKFYRLDRGLSWAFNQPIVNGARCINGRVKEEQVDLVVVHHGMMTRELRLQHKARWDRIYSTALRGDVNPYQFWAFACDEETYPPEMIRNPYL